MPSSKQIKELSDQELLAAYKLHQDMEYVGELFSRYTHLVYGVCMKYLKHTEDSQDAVVDIFEKLSKDLNNFEIENFGAWLHRVSSNFCLMKLRKDNTRGRWHDKYKNDPSANVETSTEAHQMEKEDPEKKFDSLAEAMEELSEEQKTCVDLFYIKEKSYKEVAEITGFSSKQVKSYIQNGKRNLKIMMSKALVLCIVAGAFYCAHLL